MSTSEPRQDSECMPVERFKSRNDVQLTIAVEVANVDRQRSFREEVLLLRSEGSIAVTKKQANAAAVRFGDNDVLPPIAAQITDSHRYRS